MKSFTQHFGFLQVSIFVCLLNYALDNISHSGYITLLMSVLLCLRPTKLHNCQHILHGTGFPSTPGTAFVSVTMKVYFSCSGHKIVLQIVEGGEKTKVQKQ